MLELPNELLGNRVPGATGFEPRWRRVFKLEDLPWLEAHHIQNQAVIPTALFCVMALAAAMDIRNGKQADSIELSDVTIGRPIVLEASSVEIETSLSISSLVDSGNDGIDTIHAELSLNRSAAQDPNMATVATGRLRMTFADDELALLSSSRQPKPCGLRPVNINQFYDSLSEVGLSYSGPFRALTSAERRMDYACAVVAPMTGGASSISALLHPAILEACFQTLLLAFAAPRDGSLWTTFAPTKIGRLALFPNSCFGLDTPASVTVEAHLQKYTAGYESELPRINGDVNVYSSETGQLQFRLESLTMTPISPSTERQDKRLYLKKIWRPDILSGAVLEHDDHIACYERLGPSQAHKYLLAATRLISHRYAKLNILQVGISSINLVQALCHELGNSMGSYTIADESDRAIEDMRQGLISDDLDIKFAVVDIPRGVGTLDETTPNSSINLSSFDLIILLKASTEESATLKSIRCLLKPGGFLLKTMTVTEAIPLEATDSARKEIHDMLQSVGFSGIDLLQKNPEGDSPFVILSQAVDDQVRFLKSPLDSTPPFTTRGTLLVIGGISQEIKQFIETIQDTLRGVWDGEVIVIRSLTDLKSEDLDQVEAVLSLTELDQSVLECLNHDTFHGLHQLLNKSKIALWVTHSAGNLHPYQSGTIGLVRAVQAENPEKVLQLLDLDNIDGNQRSVSESFLRLIGGVRMRDHSSYRLWTVEPELSVQGRRLLIPRVLFDKKRNDRLNCLRRG